MPLELLGDDVAGTYLRHRLRSVGLDRVSLDSKVSMVTSASSVDLHRWLATRDGSQILLASLPDDSFLAALGVSRLRPLPPSSRLVRQPPGSGCSLSLKSLNGGAAYAAGAEHDVLLRHNEDVVWLGVTLRDRRIIVAGSSLSEDLVRYAQGDPERALNRPSEALWGISGERPNYLFDGLRDADPCDERLADNWLSFLRDVLIQEGVECQDVLPGGARGALVITGDDDQAMLEKYFEQRKLLEGLPITYLLHPLSKHSRKSMDALQQYGVTEFGIHPDALDSPDRYRERLHEQVKWFAGVTGFRPKLLRNHGFLNDGYWGHASAWESEGIVASSNLPGVDGNVLNSSLLPSRLLLDGQLTDHWSLLTAFGDGMVFAAGYSDRSAADRIADFGSQVLESPLPGVVAVNLHPQNVGETPQMHEAVRQLVGRGFLAWSLGECIEWFARREGAELRLVNGAPSRGRNPLRRLRTRK